MENVKEFHQRKNTKMWMGLQRLRIVQINTEYASTFLDLPKKLIQTLQAIREMIASFKDVQEFLPTCTMQVTPNGEVVFKISWEGRWLAIDQDDDLTIGVVKGAQVSEKNIEVDH